jgi:hypothetical protein
MTEIDRTAGNLPTCETCIGSGIVVVSEMFNPQTGRTVTMLVCKECGYVTWDDRPTFPLRVASPYDAKRGA